MTDVVGLSDLFRFRARIMDDLRPVVEAQRAEIATLSEMVEKLNEAVNELLLSKQ